MVNFRKGTVKARGVPSRFGEALDTSCPQLRIIWTLLYPCAVSRELRGNPSSNRIGNTLNLFINSETPARHCKTHTYFCGQPIQLSGFSTKNVREQAADKTEINLFLSVRIVNRDRSSGIIRGFLQLLIAPRSNYSHEEQNLTINA
jgi:hypothetical protein